jgi:hypothetical protein
MMSGFGHYDRTAAELEDEIVTRGIVIGIDWNDPYAVAALAREALAGTSESRLAMLRHPDERVRAKGELFAFATLMLDIMRQSAQTGVRTPDIGVWKVLGKALAEAPPSAAGETDSR